MINVGITGFNGFLGENLFKYFLKKKINLLEIDICRINFENRPMDLIVHLANRNYVPDSFIQPYKFYNDNFNSTLSVLDFARKNKVKVIYVSSYLYGNSTSLPINENHNLMPTNPYAQSKLICENLCSGYARDFDLDIRIIRPFNIYGPQQNKNYLIPHIIQQVKEGSVILNDPEPRRDFLYVDDFSYAIELLINSDFKGFDIFNLGSGQSYSVDMIARLIMKIMGLNCNLTYKGIRRKNEIMNVVASVDKIRTILNWTPQVSMIDGLTRIINQ